MEKIIYEVLPRNNENLIYVKFKPNVIVLKKLSQQKKKIIYISYFNNLLKIDISKS